MFYSHEMLILIKDLVHVHVLPIEKFPSVVLARNAVLLEHLLTQSPLYYMYLSSGCSQEVGFSQGTPAEAKSQTSPSRALG